MFVAALLAIGAAGAYALASVLQQRAAEAEPSAVSMRAGLLLRLVRRPVWLAGVGADVSGYALQFLALGVGSLAVVQPLLVSGLLIALPLGAWLAHRRLTPNEWRAALYVVAGLAVFLAVAHPAAGRDDASGRVWLVVSSATVIPAIACAAIGVTRDGAVRARALATAAGLLYGYTAALTKTSAHLLGLGLGPLLTAWQPYALAVCGAIGMLLSQSAFQAAPLDASLPTLTVVDPVVSVLIGAFGFHESVASSPLAVIAQLGALVLVAVGVLRLGRTLSDHGTTRGVDDRRGLSRPRRPAG
jgi:hypothetical protein